MFSICRHTYENVSAMELVVQFARWRYTLKSCEHWCWSSCSSSSPASGWRAWEDNKGWLLQQTEDPHSHFAPLWNLTFQTNKYFFKFSNIETSVLAHYKQACNFIKNCSIFGAVYLLRDTCIREMVVFIVLMWHSACLHFLVLSFPTATLCVFSLGTLGF